MKEELNIAAVTILLLLNFSIKNVYSMCIVLTLKNDWIILNEIK